MKQTLLLLCALLVLCTSGAWGQVTSIDNGGLYSIQFSRTEQSMILGITSDMKHAKQNTTVVSAVFQLVETGDASTYYIKERLSGQYVYATKTTNSASGDIQRLGLGQTTLPSSNDSETQSENLDAYKWVITWIGDKGTYARKVWTIQPYQNTETYWAVWSQTGANYVAFYNGTSNEVSNDHYVWGFVQLVNPTFESMVTGGCTVSEITSAGYTLNQVAEYYKPAKLDVAGWPTTAAYNTFKDAINALADDDVVSTEYLTPYQTMCKTHKNPTIGAFYRLKDYSGNCVYATGVNEQLAVAASPSNPMSSIFYTTASDNKTRITPMLNGFPIITATEESNFPIKLYSSPGDGTSYTFDHINNHTIGTLRIIYSNSTQLYCWYISSTSVYSNTSNNTNSNRAFYFEEVTSLPVTFTTSYATLFTPVALTIPEHVKAYYISNIAGDVATLTEIETTIAANTAVILKSDEDIATSKTYNFAITTGGTDVSATNKLSGQAAAQSVAAGVAYTLQKGSAEPFEVGFYPKTAGVINGFKAYLPTANVPAAAGVKGLSFRFENADGISTTGNEPSTTNATIYDMSGRRVSQPTHGMYIVGGKKVIIK